MLQKKYLRNIIYAMEQNFDITSVLNWYIDCGVTESCGAEPSLMSKPQPATVAAVAPSAAPARPAISALAQTSVAACKNARELCEKATSLDELKQLVNSFEGCALKFNAKSTVFGSGNPQAEILIIGEAPGADEDRLGLPFVGRSGHLLDKMLAAIGVNRESVYITNILPWRPPGNRTPTDGEVAVCLPFLKRQIELIKPQVLLLLGGSAANAVLDNAEPISKMRGKWYEYKLPDKTVVQALASFHPAFLLRNSAQKAKAWADFLRILKKLKEN